MIATGTWVRLALTTWERVPNARRTLAELADEELELPDDADADEDADEVERERIGSRIRHRRLVVGQVVWTVAQPEAPWTVAPMGAWRVLTSPLAEGSAGVLVRVEREGRPPAYLAPTADEIDVLEGEPKDSKQRIDEWELPRRGWPQWNGIWKAGRWIDSLPVLWPRDTTEQSALVRAGEDPEVDAERDRIEATIRAWWPSAQAQGGKAGLRDGLMLARVHHAAGILRVERETGWIYRSWRFHITAADGGRLRKVRSGWERADVAHVRSSRCVELWNGGRVLRCEAHHVVFDLLCGGVRGQQLIQHLDGDRANNRPGNLSGVAQARVLREIMREAS